MADETKKLCTCAICYRLFRKATALRNCNHIFCWKCIYGKITKHDWKCCPVCYVEFGPDPLLLLRRDDPILEFLRTKGLFPAQKDVEMNFESSDDEETDESKNSNDEEFVFENSDDENSESENSEDEETESENSDEEETDESENSNDEEFVFENSDDEKSEYENSDNEKTESYNSDDEGIALAMDTESESD